MKPGKEGQKRLKKCAKKALLKIQADAAKSKGREPPEPEAKTEVETQSESPPKKADETSEKRRPHNEAKSNAQSEADELNELIELERKGGQSRISEGIEKQRYKMKNNLSTEWRK